MQINGSIVHSCQKLTQLGPSVILGFTKPATCTHGRILLNYKKEQKNLQSLYVVKYADTEEHILSNYVYMSVQNW